MLVCVTYVCTLHVYVGRYLVLYLPYRPDGRGNAGRGRGGEGGKGGGKGGEVIVACGFSILRDLPRQWLPCWAGAEGERRTETEPW